MEIKEFIEQFNYIKSIDYSTEDAMNNNPTPYEELEELIIRYVKEKENNSAKLQSVENVEALDEAMPAVEIEDCVKSEIAITKFIKKVNCSLHSKNSWNYDKQCFDCAFANGYNEALDDLAKTKTL